MSTTLVELIFSDIDGVWTDGSMYYSERGDELKRFNTRDSLGVAFCRLTGIEVVIITGEESESVLRRGDKLGIDEVYLGVSTKLAKAREICEPRGISLAATAAIGDGLGDVPLLSAVGFAGSVPSAPHYVKRHADYVTGRRGGEGAFLDFVERILAARGELDDAIEKFLSERR